MKQTVLNLWQDNRTLSMILLEQIIGDITLTAAGATQVEFRNFAPWWDNNRWC